MDHLSPCRRSRSPDRPTKTVKPRSAPSVVTQRRCPASSTAPPPRTASTRRVATICGRGRCRFQPSRMWHPPPRQRQRSNGVRLAPAAAGSDPGCSGCTARALGWHPFWVAPLARLTPKPPGLAVCGNNGPVGSGSRGARDTSLAGRGGRPVSSVAPRRPCRGGRRGRHIQLGAYDFMTYLPQWE